MNIINRIKTHLRKYLMLPNILRRLRYKLGLFMTNKKFDLKQHGDSVEKQKYETIDSILPTYKCFWSYYIGHDQKGNICPSNITEKSIEDKRKYVGQLYYSLLTLFLEINKIKTDISNLGNPDDVDIFLEYRKSIRNYVSTFGQIFDKEQKILQTLSISKTKQELTSKYYEGIRNFDQHSSDIPIIIEEGVVSIPKTFFLIANDTQSWFETINDRDVEFLSDFISELFEKLKMQVNNNISLVKQWFKDNTIDFQFIYPDLSEKQENLVLSAVTESYNHVSGLPQENRRERRKKK